MTSFGVLAPMLSQSPKQWYCCGREQFGCASLAAELDELPHRGILPLEQAAVAVDLVDRPRADHARIGPGGAAVVAGTFTGATMGNWPSGRWPSTRSTSHLLKNAWTSQLSVAVRM